MEEVGNSNSNSSTMVAQNEHRTTEIKCTASCNRKQLIYSSRGKTKKGIAENTWRIKAYQYTWGLETVFNSSKNVGATKGGM